MLRKQAVHIFTVMALPLFIILTFLMFGFQKRLARLETWLLVMLMR